MFSYSKTSWPFFNALDLASRGFGFLWCCCSSEYPCSDKNLSIYSFVYNGCPFIGLKCAKPNRSIGDFSGFLAGWKAKLWKGGVELCWRWKIP